METHLGKTTEVLFIWHEKGYITLQSVGCRLILRYVFMTHTYGYHALWFSLLLYTYS